MTAPPVHAGGKLSPAAVERVARALVPAWYGGFEDQTKLPDGQKWLHPAGTPNEHARRAARAAIAAYCASIAEEGMVVVPREPTDAMLNAPPRATIHSLDEHLSYRIWRAMIAAAPPSRSE